MNADRADAVQPPATTPGTDPSSSSSSFATILRRGRGPKTQQRVPALRFTQARPSNDTMVAMSALYDRGASADDILSAFREHNPSADDVYQYQVELNFGAVFADVRLGAIAASLLRYHRNSKVESYQRLRQLSVIDRLSRETICIGASSREVVDNLAGEKVTVLGHTFAFKGVDLIDSRCYADIFGVRDALATARLFELLLNLGAQPIHCSRSGAGRTAGSWVRVAFRQTGLPSCFLVNGTPADQFIIGGRIHPVRFRSTPDLQRLAPFGRRSKFALDLSDGSLSSRVANYDGSDAASDQDVVNADERHNSTPPGDANADSASEDPLADALAWTGSVDPNEDKQMTSDSDEHLEPPQADAGRL